MNSQKMLETMLHEGGMGLEEENQRITVDGFLSQRPHPFNDKRIDRDFCESQAEFITGVNHDTHLLVGELQELKTQAAVKLSESDEYLWPFSNPPYIRSDDDIRIAQFEGEKAEKTVYRNYLAEVYGKRLQTLCGIHFNYSYPDSLMSLFKEKGLTSDEVYLKLSEELVRYSWLIVALMAASPVLDASFHDSSEMGKTESGEYSSLRCSEKGYWNSFLPVLSFENVDSYMDSVYSYVKSGRLYSFSELYYPIRIKPSGENTLENLKNGINHIELRMLDVNPLYSAGINEKDLIFLVIFLAYLTDQILTKGTEPLTETEQQEAIDNMKSAAHYPLEDIHIFHYGQICPLTELTVAKLTDIVKWLNGFNADWSEVSAVEFQLDKILRPERRYSSIVIDRYGRDFVKTALKELRGETDDRQR